jgi:hypothetical protein
VRSHLSWSFPSLGCRGAMLSTALLHLCPLAAAVPSPTPCECGRSDAKASTCSVEQFLDATYFWDSVDPIPVDPNCAKDPYSAMGSEIIQGFKTSDDGNYSIIQGPSPFPPGTCGSRSSSDPRVFGPHFWKTFHTMAVNYHSPPTKAALGACSAFIKALPYMIPCTHCAWDLGQFIQTNIENSGKYNETCMGATSEHFDESLCFAPEEACKSQRSLVSFFVRAHNNVNSHTNPCRPRFTIKQGYDMYKNSSPDFCARDIVWGSKQICGGGYCAPRGPCEEMVGPVGTGTGSGPSENDYFGTDETEGCTLDTALSCGSVACKAA